VNLHGPLRELGLDDVFQLLERGRRTGALRVRSDLREDEGVVYFDAGRVYHATVRSAPEPARVGGAAGERVRRDHIESVVMELMNWREGYFSFERADDGGATSTDPRIAVDALLMAAVQHGDTWARAVRSIATLAAVPTLAPDAGAAMLELQPSEWEILAHVDGVRDLRGIAAAAGVASIEVAEAVASLCASGVVRLEGGAPARAAAVGDVAPQGGWSS
jgi:hypothetical protein